MLRSSVYVVVADEIEAITEYGPVPKDLSMEIGFVVPELFVHERSTWSILVELRVAVSPVSVVFCIGVFRLTTLLYAELLLVPMAATRY